MCKCAAIKHGQRRLIVLIFCKSTTIDKKIDRLIANRNLDSAYPQVARVKTLLCPLWFFDFLMLFIHTSR